MIAGDLAKQQVTDVNDKELLLDWLFYFDCVFKFSVRHWRNRSVSLVAFADMDKIISQPDSSPRRNLVSCVEPVDCSPEFLYCHDLTMGIRYFLC
jgi:hypothetical protein